jgi:hypothetical protein
MRNIPHIAVAPLFGWAFSVCKANFSGPGVLWAIQQNSYVKLA